MIDFQLRKLFVVSCDLSLFNYFTIDICLLVTKLKRNKPIISVIGRNKRENKRIKLNKGRKMVRNKGNRMRERKKEIMLERNGKENKY